MPPPVDDPAPAVLDALRALGLDVEVTHRRPQTWRVSAPGGSRHDYPLRPSARSTPAAAAVLPADGHLVIAAHVPEPAAEVLRHRGIHFADAAGNAHLRWPDLLVDVRGRRPARDRDALPADRASRAFGPKGQRVTFSLLCDPSTAAAPYRTIAGRSTASLGTVQAVLEELRSRGHLEVTGAQRRLHRTGALLNRWVEAFTVRAAPRLTLVRFDATRPTWWRGADEDLRTDGAVWSGEVAAHLLDPHLRPAHATLYAPGLPRRTVLAHQLRKAGGEGDVLVRETFWNWRPTSGSPLAPAPLVYADLVATGDPRCLDAAARLRNTDDLLRHLDGS